jgi:hypothetical protein
MALFTCSFTCGWIERLAQLVAFRLLDLHVIEHLLGLAMSRSSAILRRSSGFSGSVMSPSSKTQANAAIFVPWSFST